MTSVAAMGAVDTARVANAHTSVRAARDAYLTENGFTIADYTADTVVLKILGRPRALPNRPDRQWAIPLHDLHHVATGYGTDFVGEAEIGAWELAAGCRRPIVYALNAAAVLVGVFLSPRRVLAAALAGRRATALYRVAVDYDALLVGTVCELRALLGVPEDGLASGPRRLHADAEAARARAEGRAPFTLPAPGWLVALGALHGAVTATLGTLELLRGRSLAGLPLDAASMRALSIPFVLAATLEVAGATALATGYAGGARTASVGTWSLVGLGALGVLFYGASPVHALASAFVPALFALALLRGHTLR